MLHATNRSRSGFIGDLGSVALNGAVVLLALMGIAGVIFKVFKPGGWLARIAGDMAHSDAMEVVIGLGIAGWAGLCAKRWFDALDGAESRGDVLLYVALGLGVFFTFELMVNGAM
ncbi:MAG: hypothetical protein U1F52_16115 [Burkholderiales bacterium]